ncbi:M23 family metallopeptidase [Acinetobacter rathckeae]|uniref:M23 family metallopeptidase n=1 Tax=Acinetobacter rathckeae TaxID=2605272 RepID=UPI0018A323ED|nr:M23 family metallopeptidase [Acinetobacter rathckeae]MBF7688267.1 M23 family metallopeptidase [Acinetobacter rathckeae]MBF7695215.1 M23 family metallopeptidase [Acinetobacter rathckeae]
MRRILFALSVVFASPAVFADLMDNSQTSVTKADRLERTIAEGSFAQDSKEDASTKQMSTHITLRNTNKSTATKASSNEIMSWLTKNPVPSHAKVSSNFGQRVMFGKKEGHSGLDIAAPTGTPIYASGTGVVTRAGWVTGYGQFVEINHGNGYLTRYGHASRVLVSVGDRVKAGAEIAKVGCTGRCTGSHLHFEIVADGVRKNPGTYLAMLP